MDMKTLFLLKDHTEQEKPKNSISNQDEEFELYFLGTKR